LKTTDTKHGIGKNLEGSGRGLIDMVQSRKENLSRYREAKPFREDKVDRLLTRATDLNARQNYVL
jgi:hypothetical protein